MKWVMLSFQEVLSAYKIEFWCELTLDILNWGNVDPFFRQKYLLTCSLGERELRSRRRIDV